MENAYTKLKDSRMEPCVYLSVRGNAGESAVDRVAETGNRNLSIEHLTKQTIYQQ